MLLQKISLHNFRNFKKEIFEFSPHLTLIVGENARGKTNLLESIHCIANGIGYRETEEEELVRIGEEILEARGVFQSDEKKYEFQIIFQRKEKGIVRNFFFNKAPKKLFLYQQETTKVVLFSPEQISIITGTPEKRRNYFDKIISSYDYEYKKRLHNLESALYKRNKILECYKNIEELKEDLVFWNGYIIEQATYITQKRQGYIDFLNIHNKVDSKEFHINYVKNKITHERLEEYFEKEIRYRRTQIGPQKDDFILFQDKDLHKFGSRSEQRLGIFWLKLNEIKFYEKIFKKKPIILLDDIFSELDKKNKKLVLNLIKNYQTIITATEEEMFEKVEVEKRIIRL
jgi:DNA replication and repair protein RecF